jgi:hypothetical protein
MSFSNYALFKLMGVVGKILAALGVIGFFFSNGSVVGPLILLVVGVLLAWYGSFRSQTTVIRRGIR